MLYKHRRRKSTATGTFTVNVPHSFNVNYSVHPQCMPTMYLLLVGTSVYKNMYGCTHAPLKGALGKGHRSNRTW